MGLTLNGVLMAVISPLKRFEQRVKRCYEEISLDWQLVAKRSSEPPLKKIRPAALHLMNSVFVIVLVD